MIIYLTGQKAVIFFLFQPLPGWTYILYIIGPEIRENRLFWLSMIHMILIRYRGILDLLAGLSTVFALFEKLFSHAGMGYVTRNDRKYEKNRC